MIYRFTEHSANEHTFLAWIRTGVAVIGFGFVLEKFNLFILALASTASAEVGRSIRMDRLSGPIGRYECLALMLTGIVLIALGYWRFVRAERLIDDPGRRRANGDRRHRDPGAPRCGVLRVHSNWLSGGAPNRTGPPLCC